MTAWHRSDAFLGLIGTALALLTWEVAVRGGMVDPRVFPSPSIAIATAAERLSAAKLAEHAAWSMMRVTGGFLIGTAAGVVIGIAAGWFRGFGLVVRPLIEILRPIPPLAWIPLAIIWFGLGEPSKFFIIFLGAFFPVVTAAYQGMTSIDPVLIRAGQAFGLGDAGLLWRVAIPASAPDLATGIRIGWGLSFGVLVAAELIAADRGLGWLIINERNVGGSVSVIVVGILIIGLLSLATDALIAAGIRRWVGRWHGT